MFSSEPSNFFQKAGVAQNALRGIYNDCIICKSKTPLEMVVVSRTLQLGWGSNHGAVGNVKYLFISSILKFIDPEW